ELARARVPAALFAQPRSFDDQAARAARFAGAGYAYALTGVATGGTTGFADDAIAAALAWMTRARVPVLPADGAERAAEALIALVIGRDAGAVAGRDAGAVAGARAR
ncbi:MAG TPA: hypothetical protein VH165_09640, partial [Kofleriaceae bacterium]|nr:hypothetical protein [Kofleriaceae bacterium]